MDHCNHVYPVVSNTPMCLSKGYALDQNAHGVTVMGCSWKNEGLQIAVLETEDFVVSLMITFYLSATQIPEYHHSGHPLLFLWIVSDHKSPSYWPLKMYHPDYPLATSSVSACTPEFADNWTHEFVISKGHPIGPYLQFPLLHLQPDSPFLPILTTTITSHAITQPWIWSMNLLHPP